MTSSSPEASASASAGDVESPPPVERSFAHRCWLKYKDVALLALYTPFVVCLAAGNLEEEVFRQYIAQDVHFLRAFTRAYELAEECADDDDAKAAISELRKAVSEELKMHDSVLKEWGVDPTIEVIPTPATVKYTKFLLETAAGNIEGVKHIGKIVTPEKAKIAAYTVGAMTPCMRLYACLGQQLKEFLGITNGHAYQNWIDTYSSSSFMASAVEIERMLDRLSVALTFEELELVEKLYHQAMNLEIEFFSAQPVVQPTSVPLTRLHDLANPLVIISGLDLTRTVPDSSAMLPEISIQKTAKEVKPPYENDDSEADTSISQKSSDMKSSWATISKQYHEEYEQCIETPQGVGTYNFEDVYDGLEEVSNFEKPPNARAVESGILGGIKLDEKRYGDLIRSSFSSAVPFNNGGLRELTIHTNEFRYEDSVSIEEFGRAMGSPREKLKALKNILSNYRSNEKHLSVYIGDTVDDLLCLLHADVGIVIGSSPSLITLGKKFHVTFVPLYTGLICKQTQHIVHGKGYPIWKQYSTGILYTVTTWSEIAGFILEASDFSVVPR